MNNYNKILLKNCINDFFKKYRLHLATLFLLTILPAILVAIYTLKITTVEIDINSVTDANLLSFLKEESSWISFTFYRMIEFVIALIIFILPIFSVVFIPITLIVLFYKIYNYTLNLYILLLCSNILGILNTLIIVLPPILITTIIYLIFICFSIDLGIKNYKCNNCRLYYQVSRLKDKIILFTFIKIATIVYEVLLILIMSNKFIIS